MAAAQNYVTVSRRPPDVEDYIDMVRRYRSWIIGPMFAGLVIAVVVAFLWPDTYVSSAVMRITPQQIPERLIPSVVTQQMAQRIGQMQQEILSRTSLAELIQRPSLDLYKKERAKMPIDDIIQEMRAKAIDIRMMDLPTAGGDRRFASAFSITFRYPDKYRAQAVVRELVTKFTEQNVRVQRDQATMTTDFLTQELKQAKEKMDAYETQITQFRTLNQGKLPEQFQANVTNLNSLQMQLSNVNESISRYQQQKSQLETQLQTANSNLAFYSANLEESVTVQGQQLVKNEKLNGLNRQIMDLQSKIAALKELYKDEHPEMKALQASLNALQKQYDIAEKEDMALQATQPEAAPTVKRFVNTQNQKMVQDLTGTIANLKTEIQNTNVNIEEKVKQASELNRVINSYQARIESSPQLEQQYAALSRDYSLAKQAYEQMHKTSEASQTAKDLEDQKGGENLEVLDAANVSDTPAEPNRQQIAAIGAGIGLMCGIVLAGAKEMKNTSLKNLKDVRAYTNLPVLSSVPLLENALLVRRKRRLLWLAWSSAVIIGSIAMSGAAYYYYYGRNT
jgi:polysaccharide chain length determinant protein (PEP-CTERM system associated)